MLSSAAPQPHTAALDLAAELSTLRFADGAWRHAFRALLASYVEALELVGKEAA